jgi:nicotinamidase-related amidase
VSARPRDAIAGYEEAIAVYDRAQLGGAFDWGMRPAVLVVDFSTGFTDPASPLGADMTDAVLATASLLDDARAAAVPVIFTVVSYHAGMADAGIWERKLPGLSALVTGSAWTRVDPRLSPEPTELVVAKQGASALWGTNLRATLAAARIDTVVLCGATTSGCVRATAVDLLQAGYPALVPQECVADRARAPHDAALFDLQAKYADVVPVARAAAYLRAPSEAAAA